MRSYLKISFLKLYLQYLKKAIEEEEISNSLSNSSLSRLIDSTIFGSSNERIAGSLICTFFFLRSLLIILLLLEHMGNCGLNMNRQQLQVPSKCLI